MGEQRTRIRHLGVFLAVAAIAALAIGCVPEPTGEGPPTTCKTPTTVAGPTANLNGGCSTPCPTSTTAGGPVANLGGGTCPPPVTVPPQACDDSTQSGGAGVTTTGHNLGVTGPTSFLFEFDAISVPDRFEVYSDGVLIYDTGWRGSGSTSTGPDGNPITIVGPGQGSATIAVPAGTSTVVTVVVTGSSPGTAWDYIVNCPGSTV